MAGKLITTLAFFLGVLATDSLAQPQLPPDPKTTPTVCRSVLKKLGYLIESRLTGSIDTPEGRRIIERRTEIVLVPRLSEINPLDKRYPEVSLIAETLSFWRENIVSNMRVHRKIRDLYSDLISFIETDGLIVGPSDADPRILLSLYGLDKGLPISDIIPVEWQYDYPLYLYFIEVIAKDNPELLKLGEIFIDVVRTDRVNPKSLWQWFRSQVAMKRSNPKELVEGMSEIVIFEHLLETTAGLLMMRPNGEPIQVGSYFEIASEFPFYVEDRLDPSIDFIERSGSDRRSIGWTEAKQTRVDLLESSPTINRYVKDTLRKLTADGRQLLQFDFSPEAPVYVPIRIEELSGPKNLVIQLTDLDYRSSQSLSQGRAKKVILNDQGDRVQQFFDQEGNLAKEINLGNYYAEIAKNISKIEGYEKLGLIRLVDKNGFIVASFHIERGAFYIVVSHQNPEHPSARSYNFRYIPEGVVDAPIVNYSRKEKRDLNFE
jgi:hypothetical protein